MFLHRAAAEAVGDGEDNKRVAGFIPVKEREGEQSCR